MTSTPRSVRSATLVACSLALVSLAAGDASAKDHGGDAPEIVASFAPAALETPESVAFDHHGAAYVTLALTGEIRRVAPDGTQSTFAILPLGAPPLTFCGSFFAGLTAITF